MRICLHIMRYLLAMVGTAALLTSCVVGDGYLSGGAAIYYGPFHIWFHDRAWLDGGPHWHDGMFGPHPGFRSDGRARWPHIPDRPRIVSRH